jgi:ribonuclease HI
MLLKQGIDIQVNSKGKECILNMTSFPISLADNTPNRSNIILQKEFKFNFENKDLQNNILDTINNHLNSSFQNTLFVTKNSEAHFLLKDSIFSNEIKVIGSLNQNKTIKQKPFKKQVYFKNDNDNDNLIFIDLDMFTQRVSKLTETTISAFDSFSDLNNNSNPLFFSQEVKNKTSNNLHQNFINSLMKHIENFQNKGKDIQIHIAAVHMPFISSLNKHLKEHNFKPVSFQTKKINTIKQEKSEQRITKNMNEIYDELLNLNDKYLVCSDGGLLFKDTKKECISGAFIISSDKKIEKQQHSLFIKNKNSNFSELFALKKSLDYLVKNNQTDKKIHFVFDSDHASHCLHLIINNEEYNLPQNKEIFDDIKKIINSNNLQVESTVLKSHQSLINSHKLVQLNNEVDGLVKKGAKKQFHNSIK